MVTCRFEHGGRVMSVYAKRARGLLCRYAAANDVQTADELKSFDLENYKFNSKASTTNKFVFSRTKAPEKKKKKKEEEKEKKNTAAAVKEEGHGKGKGKGKGASSRPTKKRRTK